MRFCVALTLFALFATGTVSAQKPAVRASTQHLAYPAPIVLGQGKNAWGESGAFGIRGINVGPIESSQWPARGYGSHRSSALLDHLESLGANWISITPFGRIWSVNSTDIKLDFEAPYQSNRESVRDMIRQAHRRGIRVLVVPMLWVEASGTEGGQGPGWRGEIDPGSPKRWSKYQASYRRFITAWARDAALAGADAFSVGVECKSWSKSYPEVWSSIIGEVRRIFPGLLTYAANWWEEADQVAFWDALDLIGIQAFYPLASNKKASYSDYLVGAQRALARAGELGELFGKPVLFTEVGYTSRPHAAVDPWTWPDGLNVPVDEREQARALSAVFETALSKPWFTGFFVWRYYADIDDVSQEAAWGFSPHAKEAESLLHQVFHTRFASDPYPAAEAPPVMTLSRKSGSHSQGHFTSRELGSGSCLSPIWSCEAFGPLGAY